MNINPNNLGNYLVPTDTVNGVCLEVGANVGNFFSKYKNHFKLIHYYESVDETYNISKDKSDLLHNVEGFKEAAYSKDGELLKMVTHSNNESGSCSISDGKSDWGDNVVGETTSVSLETCIKRLLEDSNAKFIDYLKIDCECCEYEFLMNKDLSSIKYIGMEIHNQRGEKDWYALLKHIEKTHIISGNTEYIPNYNAELFCKLR